MQTSSAISLIVTATVYFRWSQRLWRFRKTLKKLSRTHSWSHIPILRITYNKAVSHLRKVRPKVYLDDTAVDLVDDSDADRALRIETDERLKLLEQAVDKLPPDDKMLVVLYHLEERTAGDVAYIMGMTEQNVRTRLHRVRKKLYLLMKENMNDEKR